MSPGEQLLSEATWPQKVEGLIVLSATTIKCQSSVFLLLLFLHPISCTGLPQDKYDIDNMPFIGQASLTK